MTSFDFSRLKQLIAVARTFGSAANAVHLNELEAELESSRMVAPALVPRDVVTMNSRLRLRLLPSDDLRAYRLVFPVDAGAGAENLSILTPLGTALLGRRVGTVVDTDIDGRRVTCEVTEILWQPEAAGDSHR